MASSLFMSFTKGGEATPIPKTNNPGLNLSLIRYVLFDWDGTLVDTMPAKARAFAKSVLNFAWDKFGWELDEKSKNLIEDLTKELADIYLQTAGSPRRNQVRSALEKLGIDVSNLQAEDLNPWSHVFDEHIKKALNQSPLPLFPKVLDLLKKLKKLGIQIYVSSAVVQELLSKQYDRLKEDLAQQGVDLADLIPPENVFGERKEGKKGSGHLGLIATQLGVSPEELAPACMFVGDGAHDMEVSAQAGVRLRVRISSTDKDPNATIMVRSIEDLYDLVLQSLEPPR